MNDVLENSIARFINRAAEAGEVGKIIPVEEIAQLNMTLNGLIPDWYIDIISRYPIAGIEFQWQAFEPEDDFDGLSSVWWSDAKNIQMETIEAGPGIDLIKEGYFSVACDNDGMGDPYFIKSTDSDNPMLYQICHELLAESKMVICGYTAVEVGKLSDVFDMAILSDE